MRRPLRTRRRLLLLIAAMLLPLLLLGWPAVLMLLGETGTPPFDAVVVLGARVYADGTPSLALSDRVATAAALHQRGEAPVILVSGGPGDGATPETDAMLRQLLDAGVPRDAVLIDRDGLNTRASANNAARLAQQHGWRRVAIVTHRFHLPRSVLAFGQAGIDAAPVPAVETRTLTRLPAFVLRECFAWWAYRLRLR